MTISSHPWIKLLVAVIAAIVVGIMLDSWGWGIATFFIFMFIFIWVASWIFGGDIKGKVEVDDELEELLEKLDTIGKMKDALPLNARGWCNSLGLFVQLREKGDMARLEAGDKLHAQIDAWLDNSSGTEWKVKKFDQDAWQRLFAHLVEPTFEIARYLYHEEKPTEKLMSVVNHFKTTGEWLGLYENRCASCGQPVSLWSYLKHKPCTHCGSDSGYSPKPVHNELEIEGEEPLKLEEPESKADDEVGVKTPSDIAQPRTKIEEYDQELLEDIERLKRHISKEEDIQKEFMRSYGAPEKTVEEVARKARMEGRPISFDGSSRNALRIQTFLAEMAPIYKAFPFRAWTRQQLFIPAETNVITEDDWLRFHTRVLDDEERRNYAKQWEATRVLNYTPNQIPVYKWYPNTELMRFVARMLMKYGSRSALTKDEYRDINMNAVWKETLDEG